MVGAVMAMTAVGCASVTARVDAAAGVAVRMLSAVADRGGGAACSLLAPGTAAELERSTGKPCAEAIVNAGLPASGSVLAGEVYGQWAQVRLTGDTVFLAVFDGGWRVVAAGCAGRGDEPYDCVLQRD
ncbi:hypothetical protein O7598_13000 [Micromonospora sp. WMMC241]|uniref:hypothetical protein n=1 Tax=Micromonospora sp. WMMC241 TaxID=3015159 RepID=UPI0022B6823A|nr:hypothetical protein [Micromonospora sp. WMMC241]MCZ7437316.1 hypothetical protein [Micromonospora sp. WMMC241]